MRLRFPFVAVDWGTTHMRAWLCERPDVAPETARRVNGPGIARLSRSPAATLFDAIRPWSEELGTIDLLLGGMVGSDIGWRSTPYVACPAKPADVSNAMLRFEERGHPVYIVPGIMCTNSLGQPDVMRGEETQVFGWMASDPPPAHGASWLCLPGTHTKWVRVSNGAIEAFTTALTGEMYAILRNHSVLVPDLAAVEPAFDRDAFMLGVDSSRSSGDRLIQLLFSTRARSLGDATFAAAGASYLSGLLIGADVRSWRNNDGAGGNSVGLIGDIGLCEKYAMAIDRFGLASRTWSGDAMALAGLLAVAGATR